MSIKPKTWAVAFTAGNEKSIKHPTEDVATSAVIIQNQTDSTIYISGGIGEGFHYRVLVGEEFTISSIDATRAGRDSHVDLENVFVKSDGVGNVVLMAMIS